MPHLRHNTLHLDLLDLVRFTWAHWSSLSSPATLEKVWLKEGSSLFLFHQPSPSNNKLPPAPSCSLLLQFFMRLTWVSSFSSTQLVARSSECCCSSAPKATQLFSCSGTPTEPQSHGGWKGPLGLPQSNPPQADSPEQVTTTSHKPNKIFMKSPRCAPREAISNHVDISLGKGKEIQQ